MRQNRFAVISTRRRRPSMKTRSVSTRSEASTASWVDRPRAFSIRHTSLRATSTFARPQPVTPMLSTQA